MTARLTRTSPPSGICARKVGLLFGLLLGLTACAWAAAAAAEAPGAAAGQAMEELGVCLNAKGTVYCYDDRTLEALVTIGSSHGLRPQARVAFMRKGVMVAEGQVVAVREVDASVRVDKDVPAGTVLRGDDVKVLRNGPRSAVVAAVARENRDRAWTSFLVFGLFVGLILI